MFLVIYRSSCKSLSISAIVRDSFPYTNRPLRWALDNVIMLSNEKSLFAILLSTPFCAGNVSPNISQNGIHTGF